MLHAFWSPIALARPYDQKRGDIRACTNPRKNCLRIRHKNQLLVRGLPPNLPLRRAALALALDFTLPIRLAAFCNRVFIAAEA